ncbi:MAG: heme o synthase [Pseudomonadota bacterium]
MNTLAAACSRNPLALAREVLGLFKLRIGVIVMVTALAGVVIAPGPGPGVWRTLVLGLAVLLASAAAGGFNQYYEAEADRLMARTRRRAFVTGALPRSPAWLAVFAAMLLLSFAAAWWAANLTAAAFSLLGAFVYGVVYTVWLKRRSWLNIVIGGLAGSFAVLAGSTAVAPWSSPLPLLMALVLFLWTPPHFWSLAIAGHADYRAAGVPMLPVVVGPERAARAVFYSTVALVAASMLPLAYGAGWVYGLGAAVGGAVFLYRSAQLALKPGRSTALRSFFASLLQLPLLLAAACADAWMR